MNEVLNWLGVKLSNLLDVYFRFLFGCEPTLRDQLDGYFGLIMCTLLFGITTGYIIGYLYDIRKDLKKLNDKYEFYLFEDEVRGKKIKIWISHIASIIFFAFFGYGMTLLLIGMYIPEQTPYAFWRWLRGFWFYTI